MARRAVGCYKVIWAGPKTDQIDTSNKTQLAALVNGHLSELFQMTVGNSQRSIVTTIICFVPVENNG